MTAPTSSYHYTAIDDTAHVLHETQMIFGFVFNNGRKDVVELPGLDSVRTIEVDLVGSADKFLGDFVKLVMANAAIVTASPIFCQMI